MALCAECGCGRSVRLNGVLVRLPPLERIRRWLVRTLSALGGLLWFACALGAGSHDTTLREQRVFGYTDEAGTTVLTNLPESSPGSMHPRLVVDLHERSVGPRGRSDAAAGPLLPASADLRQWVEEASHQERLEPALVYAVMAAESGYNPRAVSPKGARGLMQLMPETGESYGVKDFFDSRESIFAGAQHLRRLLDQFQGDMSLALAAYNAGSSAVIRYHNAIPPFSETQAYVPRVLSGYAHLRSPAPK